MSTRISAPYTYTKTMRDGSKVTRTRCSTYTVKNIRAEITDEMKQKIIEMYELSVPKTAIAEKIGISVCRVNSVLKAAGVLHIKRRKPRKIESAVH